MNGLTLLKVHRKKKRLVILGVKKKSKLRTVNKNISYTLVNHSEFKTENHYE